ncbi:MAG: hypothetical protein HY080_11640 [Gammaproteobacteria bacterium]|nr:hypothetical protein [Gammaproteobacteria bacterium]
MPRVDEERAVHITVLAVVVGVLCAGFVSRGHAQPTAGTADPFGGEDPFAVLKEVGPASEPPSGDTRGTANAPSQPIKVDGSVFLKNTRNDLNLGSRINPDNRIQLVMADLTQLETRLTTTDYLNESKSWRWLFKGYSAASSYREPDATLREESRIDELFADWKGEYSFVNLGKRRITWGHAQGFNPVNVVVPLRDPLDPSRETEGQPMLWVNRLLGAQSLDVIITRNYDRWYHSDSHRWGLKWGLSVPQRDFALYYFDGERYPDGRPYERMLGGSFSADVFPGVTFYMEAARFAENYRNYYNTSAIPVTQDSPYWQAVAGSSLDLGSKTRVFVEYYRNQQGYSSNQRQNYFRSADAQLAVGSNTSITRDYRVMAMNRDYLLLSYQDEFREHYTLDSSALMASDRSYSLRLQGKYAISDYYELRLVLSHNNGARDSEFGNNPVSNALELWLGANF